ncbi:MAG: phosphoenolpyruvate--protein phosphotransferase [Phycisphaerales bacterium]|nr:phosphoenolpyruvate--protein phosphotransferase [Phycisphaerales bacterium]MCB9856223.1 phosphoenolpyruvate--protein phosphotransferase [Phycisphaerales bacterium]MCB9863338.1 phosphoenolpyruvate--protein phosphotransferase [Phycisphaerales bacterium]
MALEIRQRCPLPNGLHARPAAMLSAVARKFASSITLVNEESGKQANAKSPLSSITLDLRHDDAYRVLIEGDDEADAHQSLSQFLTVEFSLCDSPLPDVDTDRAAMPLSPMLAACGADFFRGLPVVGGVGEGRLVDLHREVTLPASVQNEVINPDRECLRAVTAIERVVGRFEARILTAGSLERDVIEAQRSILEDDRFRTQIEDAIRRDHCNVGRAVQIAGMELGEMLRATGNPLLGARADDIDDICRHLLIELYGEKVVSALPEFEEDSIIVAETLLASELLALDLKRLKGLVLGNTSSTAHVVIVARSRGIPTLVGVETARLRGLIGSHVIADGESGVVAAGDVRGCGHYYELERSRIKDRMRFEAERSASAGGNGRIGRVLLMANASSIEDIERATAAGAGGIGLLRTELLFGGWQTAPTEDEQYEDYRRCIDAAGGKSVTIRLFDCGGDKPLAFMPVSPETNPFLGWRGVRMYDAYADVIDAQIRAILRARAHGDVRILVPMVASVEEIAGVRSRVARLAEALQANGESIDRDIPIGVMLEVPAAVWIIDQLARHSDFFSVGTNDLAQYFSAADRENPRVSGIADVFAPAFLRVLRQIAIVARRANRPFAMCGEMAGNALAAPLLLAMGFEELSMAVESLGRVRSRLAGLDETKCAELLEGVVAAESADEIRTHVARFDGSAKVRSLLEPSLVICDIACDSRAEAIKRLVDRLYVTGRTETPRELEQAVWIRERTTPTGLGFGFAVPHCKSDYVIANSIVVARLKKAINWDGEDDVPTRFVFLLAVRESAAASEYMDVLKTLAVRIMDDEFRASVASAAGADGLYKVISTSLGEIPAMTTQT